MGASAVKTWLRLGYSVKCCDPSPEQHCTTAGTGSLGEGETLCQGNAKLLWWFIHLGWLCWGVQIFRLLVNSTRLHDRVCYWPLLLRNQLSAHCRVLLLCVFYSHLQVQQCQNMQLGLRTSLEKDSGAIWRQPCRNAALAFAGDAVWVTLPWRHVCRERKDSFIDITCLFLHPLPTLKENVWPFSLGQGKQWVCCRRLKCPEYLSGLSLSCTWCSSVLALL